MRDAEKIVCDTCVACTEECALIDKARRWIQADELLEKARALCQAATPGPWEILVDADEDAAGVGSISGDMQIEAKNLTVCTLLDYVEYDNSVNNANFISETRELLPLLIDLAEKRGAIAAEERAKIRRMLTRDELEIMEDAWYNHTDQLDRDLYCSDARKDLQVESSQWHRIEPDDAKDIAELIAELEYSDEYQDDHILEVLRRLISEEKA